jgi:hypothetical protein
MLKQSISRLSLSALILAGTIGASAAAIASDDLSGTYSKYYESIYLSQQCRGTEIDAAGWKKLADYIDNKVNHEIGAGDRLTLIETAKTDARVLKQTKGCDHQSVQDLLKVYDSELASL